MTKAQKKVEPLRLLEQKPVRQHKPAPVQAVAPQAAYRRAQVNRNELTHTALLTLQRTVGNRQVQQMFAQPTFSTNGLQPHAREEANPGIKVQPKLTVGAPNDSYEQEADRVAAQVVQRLAVSSQPSSVGTPSVQLKCPACEEKERLQKMAGEEEEKIQQKTDSSDLENRLNASKGGGQPLPADSRAAMEGAFGADFSGVRVHAGSEAVQMNKALNAQAFTHGNDIFFNQGKGDFGSEGGKRLLAHELTHTIQQNKGLALKIQRSNPAVVAEPPVRSNAQACLVHLHGDEPNALDVAKALHQQFCVNLTFIDNPGARLINIDVPGFPHLTCRADPNRIFQDAAIDRLWRTWNSMTPALLRDPAKAAAQRAVRDFRDNELNPKIRQCRGQATDVNGGVASSSLAGALPVVAFHNNTNNGNLTIRSYQPGGREAAATETDPANLGGAFAQIRQNPGSGNPPAPSNPHVQRGADGDDFILVTTSSDFVDLFRQGRNVVLQSQTPPQDGSLSVVLSGGRYVNVEAQQGRRTNAIQEAMGQQALGSLGVTQCPAAASPGSATTTSSLPEPPSIQKQTTDEPDAAQSAPAGDHSQQEPSSEEPLTLEQIINTILELLREVSRVLDSLSRRPESMPRQAPPQTLPANCLIFNTQADLDAEKARWDGIIGSMPVTNVINWIIGAAQPPTTPENVRTMTQRQANCMIQAMQSATTLSGSRIGLGPGGAQGRGGHIHSQYRNAADQRNIWMEKFNFTRRRPFDRINDEARNVCGATLLPASERRWNTSNARHRVCWGVDPATTAIAFDPGKRALNDEEKQRQILEASSAPGISRHHWGTDVDLFDPDMNPAQWEAGEPFADAYSWMMRNASTYGFVQSYNLTSTFMRLGYMEERWHWSYYPISQALLEFARSHRPAIQRELTGSWGSNPAFSYISSHWREFMFNVNQTPIF